MIAIRGYVVTKESRGVVHADDATAALQHRREISEVLLRVGKSIWRKCVTNKDNCGRLIAGFFPGPSMKDIHSHTEGLIHVLQTIAHQPAPGGDFMGARWMIAGPDNDNNTRLAFGASYLTEEQHNQQRCESAFHRDLQWNAAKRKLITPL
jgi:hypothetical protein